MSQEERDLLIRIDENLIHIKDWSSKHDILDDKRFEDVKKELEVGKRVFYGGLGIWVFLEVISKLVK